MMWLTVEGMVFLTYLQHYGLVSTDHTGQRNDIK